MSIPKAFISYSHDSQKHKKWVLDLATRLRNTGVDAILDQWELGPGDDLPHFMERHLASADRVLMICTDRYVEKANAGAGGVGYEKMIVTADLLKTIDSNKVIPIIRQSGTYARPTFLKSKLFLDFSRDDQYEFSFDELTRALHNAPLFVKPPVGNNPFDPIKSPERSGDALAKLMTVVVSMFESQSHEDMHYSSLLQTWSGSRTMFDILVEEARAEGLLTLDTYRFLQITAKGKLYALQHKLVN
ncbi:MAG: hypothetical protein JWM21_3832 [Acidobacteria bacterium]|nr:hypothetical protein [Acidobacteriota bacterium]